VRVMLIEIEKLGSEPQTVVQSFAASDFATGVDDVALSGTAQLNARLTRIDDQTVEVAGSVSAALDAVCDRCLGPASWQLNNEFVERFVSRVELGPGEHELGLSELDVSEFDGVSLDIEAITREQIILGLPARYLCSDACKGLCPNCRANLNSGSCACHIENIDPRWGALRNLT
jgi:uncharacterized protein